MGWELLCRGQEIIYFHRSNFILQWTKIKSKKNTNHIPKASVVALLWLLNKFVELSKQDTVQKVESFVAIWPCFAEFCIYFPRRDVLD